MANRYMTDAEIQAEVERQIEEQRREREAEVEEHMQNRGIADVESYRGSLREWQDRERRKAAEHDRRLREEAQANRRTSSLTATSGHIEDSRVGAKRRRRERRDEQLRTGEIQGDRRIVDFRYGGEKWYSKTYCRNILGTGSVGSIGSGPMWMYEARTNAGLGS